MKILTRIAFLSFLCAIIPFSNSFAEEQGTSFEDVLSEAAAMEEPAAPGDMDSEDFDDEMAMDDEEMDEDSVPTLDQAKKIINSSSAAKDAVGGTVPLNPNTYYDIHGRQLAYRENAKALRASLEARRKDFERPRTEIVEKHRSNVEKVYAAETAAYLDEQSESDESGSDMMDEDLFDEETASMDGAVEETQTAAVDEESAGGLSEQEIPTVSGEEGPIKRKVVTSDDAPNFDPANLPQ